MTMEDPMRRFAVVLLILVAVSAEAIAANTKPATPAGKPARSTVDPALEAAHAKEDIKRHRTIAAAHEAAVKCLESGRDEEVCNAELAKACQGIAYGKYCGMKHPD
jgi:hypothetical protein